VLDQSTSSLSSQTRCSSKARILLEISHNYHGFYPGPFSLSLGEQGQAYFAAGKTVLAGTGLILQ